MSKTISTTHSSQDSWSKTHSVTQSKSESQSQSETKRVLDEALLGQIAVGDVILNRVKSPLFPGTIYSVIFDKKYGVQFSPTQDGRIYSTPTYTATLAAKICLEGISLSDDAMYFLNPRTAQSNWIVKNKRYVYTIGNHDFYA